VSPSTSLLNSAEVRAMTRIDLLDTNKKQQQFEFGHINKKRKIERTKSRKNKRCTHNVPRAR